MRRKNSGFSLIELIVVIAIIGVLSTVVMASLSSARAKGRDGRRLSDIKQIQLALELYYDASEPHTYPTSLSALTGPGYIPNVPKDPRTGLDYAYVGLRGASATVCGSYHLGAKLEQYSSAAGSAFNDDSDKTTGTWPTGNGTPCTGSSWVGNADIAAVSGDFDGTNDATNRVFDIRR